MALFTTETLNPNMIAGYFLSEILVYPFQTAYKRFVCQVNYYINILEHSYSWYDSYQVQ